MTIFKLPDLGEGLPDAEIKAWHVKVGEHIDKDQHIASVETAKALVDVPSPHSGVIKKLYGKPGDIIKTGHPFVEFAIQTPIRESSATVAGKLEIGDQLVPETAVIAPHLIKVPSVKATPAIRALAAQFDIDLNHVDGTGPNGLITKFDLERAQMAHSHALKAGEPLKGTRRTMAQTMSKAHKEVVPITLSDDALLGAWKEKNDITYRIIRALCIACEKEPNLNAWFDGSNLSHEVHKQVDLGLAMDSAEGLFVPIIHDAATQLKHPDALRDSIEQRKRQVKERSITADQMKNPTITLSNFGTVAGKYANPIIIPPQVAIIGSGKIREMAIPVQGKVTIQPVLPLSLTIDHRAVTGGEAARFLAAMIEDLQKQE